jgi:superfamily I DNA and/or RNA helicase
VFLAALQLHKEFLRHVPAEMHRSLLGAIDVLTGAAPKDLSEDKALAAWHALFFVVPVVSTTFASLARMFSHLGRESLGWMLIDEGGQAAPQSAAGAIWRAKRAVVVGDPLQLEPITKLSFRTEQSLAREHGVDGQWSPSKLSTQRLADRVTPFGTWLPDGDEQIWVGAPLTVHRRCDDPMFRIVNQIAYDNLMIHATDPGRAAAFDARYRLPESKWIDVAAATSDGNWIPAEGEQLDRILSALHAREIDMTQVLAIAPFRDGSRQLVRRTWRYKGLRAGTIHTAQGKEADIVILVLGGDPRKPGARSWAARKPNLLNVAVSRAKRRLYVVGSWDAWAPHQHFDVLARWLPRESPGRA